MITAIYSLSNVHGAELWLVGWVLCALFYIGGCMLVPVNRPKTCRTVVWIGLLIAEVVNDLIWALIYYPNGSYINYGVGAVYGLFLWPLILLIAGVFVTVRNEVRCAKQKEIK